MAKETKPDGPTAAPASPVEAGVKVVIMQDGVFSSIGVHNKGDKVVLSEADVVILEGKGFATRLGG
jgi:hypothetical protein